MNNKFTKLNITSEFEVYESENDLPGEENKLLQKAKEALKNAHAPYSGFFVGAAVLLENGEIVLGNNQENAAYPSGLCAERVTIFSASSNFSSIPFKTLAISCKSVQTIIEGPVTPCGACRQVIAEYETKFNKPIRIIMQGKNGNVYAVNSTSALLPLMFNHKYLK